MKNVKTQADYIKDGNIIKTIKSEIRISDTEFNEYFSNKKEIELGVPFYETFNFNDYVDKHAITYKYKESYKINEKIKYEIYKYVDTEWVIDEENSFDIVCVKKENDLSIFVADYIAESTEIKMEILVTEVDETPIIENSKLATYYKENDYVRDPHLSDEINYVLSKK